MNYRHTYHAGNFADLLKHAVLTDLLRTLTRARPPLTVIDTHAGAGLYDLNSGEARRTGEGVAGIGRLMTVRDAPPIFDDLKAAVVRANQKEAIRYYPGSPRIVADWLRPGDRYIGCELRADDHAALRASMLRARGASILKCDGWVAGAERAPKSPTPLLVLVDPSFERGDDPDQAARLTRLIMKRNPEAVVAVWVPIKDLTGFDALVTSLADAAAQAPMMVAEVRLRPLTDPMRLNGCAMIVANPAPGLDQRSNDAAVWIARTLGEPGGLGRIEQIAPAR